MVEFVLGHSRYSVRFERILFKNHTGLLVTGYVI